MSDFRDGQPIVLTVTAFRSSDIAVASSWVVAGHQQKDTLVDPKSASRRWPSVPEMSVEKLQIPLE
jgi:hypothetical protein